MSPFILLAGAFAPTLLRFARRKWIIFTQYDSRFYARAFRIRFSLSPYPRRLLRTFSAPNGVARHQHRDFAHVSIDTINLCRLSSVCAPFKLDFVALAATERNEESSIGKPSAE